VQLDAPLAPELATRALTTAGGDEAGFYYAKAPVDRIDIVRALGACGFYGVDVNVTFAASASDARGGSRSGDGIDVRDAQSGDADAVLEIAGSAFRYSRFHLDPAMGRDVANRIKREWIRNYVCGRRGVGLLVASARGTVAGFLAVLATERAGRRIRVIDLVAVSPRHQRRGVGRALVTAFMERSRFEADLLEVGTQIANVPSIQLYQGCGFSIDRAAYVLHRHVPATVAV